MNWQTPLDHELTDYGYELTENQKNSKQMAKP